MIATSRCSVSTASAAVHGAHAAAADAVENAVLAYRSSDHLGELTSLVSAATACQTAPSLVAGHDRVTAGYLLQPVVVPLVLFPIARGV